MIMATNTTFSTVAGSCPEAIDQITAVVAPTPAHTAYAVPMGMVRMAHASPPMEITTVTANTREGPSRVKPWERAIASAHTASKSPETIKITQFMGYLSGRLVAVSGTAPSSDSAHNPGCTPLSYTALSGTMGTMKIAFLGLGRMGTELALKLVDDHELTVWNRTADKTKPLVEKGAQAADSPEAAVEGADLVITSLFGPDTVRKVVIQPGLIPEGVTWADSTTISPEDADEFADAVSTYVHTPVVGTLTPARNGKLGVYVGGTDASRRDTVATVVAPWAAANPERLKVVDSAAKAATGKLLANLALAVTAQGYKEALYLGESQGLSAEEVSEMLGSTGLEFMRNMKQPFVQGERETSPGDFTVDAIAKDARLMLDTSEQDLPAVRAALDSLEGQQDADRGDHDFSSLLVYRNE